jgi:hypothetical protein
LYSAASLSKQKKRFCSRLTSENLESKAALLVDTRTNIPNKSDAEYSTFADLCMDLPILDDELSLLMQYAWPEVQSLILDITDLCGLKSPAATTSRELF